IITGAGPGGGPHVEAFDGTNGNLLKSFFAFPNTFHNGVWVSAGDVNADGKADIIAGQGPGGTSEIRVFGGLDLSVLQDFTPYGAFAGGGRVAAVDVNNDGKADIITAAGPGGGPHVKAFDGTNPAN